MSFACPRWTAGGPSRPSERVQVLRLAPTASFIKSTWSDDEQFWTKVDDLSPLDMRGRRASYRQQRIASS
jgi:hypothetical protein